MGNWFHPKAIRWFRNWSDLSELKLQHLGIYNVPLFLTLTVVTPLNLLGELATHSLCWWPKSHLELLVPLQLTKLFSVSVNFFPTTNRIKAVF